MQGSEIFARLWLIPWYWFHSAGAVPSCWILICAIVSDWLGFLVCGALLATLVGRRATYAAMVWDCSANQQRALQESKCDRKLNSTGNNISICIE
jgi:hypothetical protein